MRVVVSTGEPSGRLMADLLEKALTRNGRDVHIDVRQVTPSTEGVMGYWEGLKAVPALRRQLGAIYGQIVDFQPDVAVLVGFSGFNAKLGKRIRKARVPVVYLAPPQVWAWGGYRTRSLRHVADRFVALFPFEQALLSKAGLDAVFLGYPLLDVLDSYAERAETLARLGLGEDTRYVAFLPGSRQSEMAFHRPRFRRVSEALAQVRPEVRSVFVELRESETPEERRRLVRERYGIIAHAECAVVVSGTASLETALLGVPEVVCYHLSPATRLMARALVKTKWFSLPNILLGDAVVPEILEPSVGQLADAVLEMLGDLTARRKAAERKAELQMLLGPRGAVERIGDAVLDCAGNGVPCC